MNINYCANCGAKITVGASFCSECGSKLERSKKNDLSKKGDLSIKQESISGLKSKSSEKKNKGGFLKRIEKVMLWLFGLLIVAVVGLYFLGDSPDENNSTELKTETPIKVREANPVLTNNVSFPITSSSKVQVFNYTDSVKISLPPDFTSKNQKLFVSKAKVDPSIMVEDAEPLMLIDLTLDDGEQPAKSLEISYTYDKADLNPNFTAEEQLTAFRWDEEGGGWVNLPIRIDEKKHEVSVLTDHLSIFTIGLAVVGIIKTAKAYVDYKDSKKLTGIYVTPQKNFRILYSKQEINKDVYLKDKKWRRTYSSPDIKYSSKHPLFIQDMGGILEQALNRYTNSLFPEFTYGFRTPTGEFRNAYFGTFHKMLTVKMDSYLQEFTWPKDLSDPFYEKLQERLYIPTTKCIGGKTAKLTLAHELFHAVQAQYYGRLGMYDSGNQWWLEATAEYAAYEVAWPKPLTGIGDAGGSNYLTFPVISRGTKKGHGWSRDYEYASAIWIKYLVDIEQYDFEDMIEYDASDNLPSINSLEKYSSKTIKLGDAYRNFANWMTFSSDSPLKKYPLDILSATSANQNNSIAVLSSTLKLGSAKEITNYFELPDNYSSKLWAIKVTKGALDNNIERKPILIKLKSKSFGISVDVFVEAQGERFLNPPKPIKSIYTKDKPVMILVKPTDIIYVSATQGSETGGEAEVIVSDAGIILEIDPAELPNVKPREANDFALTAKNIPEEIKKVTFEWNYNDGSEKGIHDFVSVSNSEANQKISHRYEESDKEEIYPLKVVLKEAGKSTILAEAEALVTLPLAKPKLLVEPGISVGPPGATFDMEAKVSPRNTYKFVWEISGFGESYTQEGEESGIAPIIDKEGEYAITVKLYDLAGNYLDMAQASISVKPDELDTEDVDGIVEIEEIEGTNTGHWVLYDTKEINGCQFFESECWPLEDCSGGEGSFNIIIGSSTCGSKAAGYSGSGTYTVPPSTLYPGKNYSFKATAEGRGYTSINIRYYSNKEKMSFDEKGNNTGDSSDWNERIVKNKNSPRKYAIPVDLNKGGVLLIDAGGSTGSFETSKRYFYLYKWQK